jgi:hypothetical protein
LRTPKKDQNTAFIVVPNVAGFADGLFAWSFMAFTSVR